MLLRREPTNVADQKDALRRAMAALLGPVLIEAGIEGSQVPDDNSLKGRLLYRRVDSIVVSEDAPPAEVLTLARALASDDLPVGSSSGIQVELLPASAVRSDLHPVAPPPVSLPDEPPPSRSRTMSGPVDEAQRIATALDHSFDQGNWMEALHAAQALVRLTLRFPDHERRAYLLSLRRIFTRRMLDEFIQFSMRSTEEQARIAEVLQFSGPEAIELMVDHICQSESIGPRRFIHDILASTPDSVPLLLPLLSSPRWHEVRHSAELLGRLQVPDTIPALRSAMEHPDARARQAAVLALAEFPDQSVILPIRRALADPSPLTRASAAHALSRRSSPGLAMPLVAALESEKDPVAWSALMTALAGIDSTEGMNELVTLALDRHPMLKAGRPMSQRLAIVQALAGRKNVAVVRRALERLVKEGEGPVRRTAEEALKDQSSS
ncbi:MAG: HEAT repeat domain-containing protein [Gemmatimonadota bacterium]